LKNPDFNTAVRIVDAINAYGRQRYGERLAREQDQRSVALMKPQRIGTSRFMAEIGDLLVDPDIPRAWSLMRGAEPSSLVRMSGSPLLR